METLEYYNTNTNNFKGKNIMVTGATGGIGSQVTQSLIKLGANVIATSRSEKKIVDKLASCVKKENFDKEIINFAIPNSITRGFTSIMKKFGGRIDGVIICHAVFKVGRLMETNIDAFDTTLNVNVRSCFNLVSIASPFLKLSKGSIVICSSLESLIPVNESFMNSLSKSMLNSLVQNAALELAPFGVRVNAVAPGMTDTEFRVTEEFDKKENKLFLEKMSDFFLLNRKVLDANDVANAILYLASEESRFMTGEILPVDNGYSLNHDLSFAPPEDE